MEVVGPDGPLTMTGQTVGGLISVSGGELALRASFDLTPGFRRCFLLRLGLLLPEGDPSYPSVIDQVH